jgi:hypothetical protein
VLSALHEQPVIPVADPDTFGALRSAIETAFSPARVKDFLKSLERAGLRIRDFETVLGKAKLGPSAAAGYNTLGNGDQGQIREFYLATLEKVPADLRVKFYRLYAYY